MTLWDELIRKITSHPIPGANRMSYRVRGLFRLGAMLPWPSRPTGFDPVSHDQSIRAKPTGYSVSDATKPYGQQDIKIWPTRSQATRHARRLNLKHLKETGSMAWKEPE
jgi:hypothetical protein